MDFSKQGYLFSDMQFSDGFSACLSLLDVLKLDLLDIDLYPTIN